MKIPIVFMGSSTEVGEAVRILVTNAYPASDDTQKRSRALRLLARQAGCLRLLYTAAPEVSPSTLGVVRPVDGRIAPADAPG